jgi:hypothetical protein
MREQCEEIWLQLFDEIIPEFVLNRETSREFSLWAVEESFHIYWDVTIFHSMVATHPCAQPTQMAPFHAYVRTKK